MLLGLLWVTIVWTWRLAPLTLTVDDSFYYFQTARRIAAGEGPTFDGIQPTNGFHPLWMAVLVPIAAALGRQADTFVRVVLTLQIALVALGTWRLGRCLEDVPMAALVFAGFATNFYFVKILVNGLESALEYALIAVAIEVAGHAVRAHAAGRHHRLFVLAGALGACVTLTRLTAIVFAVLLLLVMIRRARPPRRAVVATASAFALPLGAYALYSLRRFGHVVPVSAAIKIKPGVVSPGSVMVTLLAIAAVVAVVRLEVRRRSPAQLPIWLVALVGYVAVQTACDALLRDVVVPEIWYLVPHATLAVLASATALNRPSPRRWPARVAGAVMLAFALVTWVVRVDPSGYAPYVAARQTGEWLGHNTPVTARVAGWDCGIAAFYSDRTFLNLDGLISSWDYKERYLDRGRSRQFLDDTGIDFVAQYTDVSDDPSAIWLKDVDLSDWRIVYESRVEFRGILRPFGRAVPLRYLVLRRP
jgi:hypothetical protein